MSTTETVTKGGIMLPEKPQGKVFQAIVVAVGWGSKGNQLLWKLEIKLELILPPEYGGIKVVLDSKNYFLLEMMTFLENK